MPYATWACGSRLSLQLRKIYKINCYYIRTPPFNYSRYMKYKSSRAFSSSQQMNGMRVMSFSILSPNTSIFYVKGSKKVFCKRCKVSQVWQMGFCSEFCSPILQIKYAIYWKIHGVDKISGKNRKGGVRHTSLGKTANVSWIGDQWMQRLTSLEQKDCTAEQDRN